MKLRHRVGLEFALALGILALSGLASYRSLVGLTNTLHSLAGSYERLDRLALLQSRLAGAESAASGYLLTGSGEYYQVYVSADRSVQESVADLGHVMDSDAQQRFFRDLDGPIRARTEVLRELVNLHQRKALLDAEQKALATQSSDSLSRVNRALDEIRRTELQLLGQREQDAVKRTHETILTLGAAFLAGFLLLISAFYLLTEEVQQRREREGEIRRFSLALEQRNREVERATRLKSQFLASMSHELRTPLNAIIGFSDLLAEDDSASISGKQKRHLEHIRTAGRHLLQLINDILDLAKVETGRMTLHVENLAAAEVLPEVLSTISPLAMKKKITVQSDIQGSLRLKADRVRLKQAFYNLLSNAVKFTPDGGRVSITGRQQEDFVELAVSDTGCGIRPEDHEAIFEEFRQIGETTKGVKEGTGLGLAITRKLIEQQGGSIRVESEVGKGATFIFTLPGAPRLTEPPREPEAPEARRTGRPLVLVVDDEPVARELLVSHLAVDGFRTANMSSGHEAVAMAAGLHPDAITLDILSDGFRGRNTLKELKSKPETAGIPVVVVTVADQREEALSLGAAEYLVKPVRREDLLAAVRRQVFAHSGGLPAVLVVDDDPDVQHSLADRLETAGFVAIVAGSGLQALDVLWHRRVQAIILDLFMPEMDGFEVIRRIRRNPRLHSIPFFALTARGLTESETESLSREACCHFLKQGDWMNDLLRQIGSVHSQQA
jgi:signal transduction histidine kinase/CheY-like chemotaxis protein